MLWQQLAKEEKDSELHSQIDSANQLVTTLQTEQVAAAQAHRRILGITSLNQVLETSRKRLLTHLFNRWSCSALALRAKEVEAEEGAQRMECALTEARLKHTSCMCSV